MVGGSQKGVEQVATLPCSPHTWVRLEPTSPGRTFLLTDSPETIGLGRTHQERLVSGSKLNLQAR